MIENAAVVFVWASGKLDTAADSGNSRLSRNVADTGSDLMNCSAVVVQSPAARMDLPRSVKTAIAINAPQLSGSNRGQTLSWSGETRTGRSTPRLLTVTFIGVGTVGTFNTSVSSFQNT